jgi:hypothetical protein
MNGRTLYTFTGNMVGKFKMLQQEIKFILLTSGSQPRVHEAMRRTIYNVKLW